MKYKYWNTFVTQIMSTVDYNAWNPEKKRCSYHNKQSPREFRVLLQLILSVMSAIYGWAPAIDSTR